MRENGNLECMLGPYRVLDLTDEKGVLCGKLLGDLGADVIKVERPMGDPARRIGPFYRDEPDPEKSLFWFAYNNNKRGVTLDIETADGREIFRRLVDNADFVIESFPPGYMDDLGLGYPVLEKLNPRVIMVSITPFGQTGPFKDYKAPDIVAWAMGGHMYVFGDTDRPPVRIGHHSQAYLHAGAKGAVGAMVAHQYRELTGEGQQVDVSIQESVAQVTYAITHGWDMMQVIQQRGEAYLKTSVHLRHIWPCRDGYVAWVYWTGSYAKRWNTPLVKWMAEEGIADEFLRGFDWDTFDYNTATQEMINRIAEPTTKFFKAHTKAELLEGAVSRNLLLAPVSDVSDMAGSPQLAARGYWAELEHPELGTSLLYPGAFAQSSEASPRVTRRAPLIGEHNIEVYEKELGISRGELITLKQAKVI